MDEWVALSHPLSPCLSKTRVCCASALCESMRSTIIKATHNKDTYNKDAYDKDTDNKDTYNKDTDNKDTDNKDTYNKDTYNKDTYNKNTYNKDTYNKDTDNKDTDNKDSIFEKALCTSVCLWIMARRTHANVCDMMSWHVVASWHAVTSCRTPSHVRYDDIYLRRGHDIREAALHTDTHEQNHSRTHTRLIYVFACDMTIYTLGEGTTFEKPLCTQTPTYRLTHQLIFASSMCMRAIWRYNSAERARHSRSRSAHRHPQTDLLTNSFSPHLCVCVQYDAIYLQRGHDISEATLTCVCIFDKPFCTLFKKAFCTLKFQKPLCTFVHCRSWQVEATFIWHTCRYAVTVWHDAFTRVTWCSHSVTWRIHTCAVTRSHLCRDVLTGGRKLHCNSVDRGAGSWRHRWNVSKVNVNKKISKVNVSQKFSNPGSTVTLRWRNIPPKSILEKNEINFLTSWLFMSKPSGELSFDNAQVNVSTECSKVDLQWLYEFSHKSALQWLYSWRKFSPKVGSVLKKKNETIFRSSRLFIDFRADLSSRLFIDFRADLWDKTFRFYDEETFSKSRLFSRKNELSFLTSGLFMLWIKRQVVFWQGQGQLAQGQLITQKTSHEKSALQRLYVVHES